MNAAPHPVQQRTSYVPGWAPETFIVPLLAKRIPELFQQFCKPQQSGARALDVGCGLQPFRGMLVEAGYDYHSMDVVQNRAGTVEFVASLDAPLPSTLCNCQPFDFIVCTEVLEHVADWRTAFENFSKLLAPKGRVLITCPHFYPLHEAPYDYWRPTPYTIERFADANGMRVVHVEQLGGPWEVLGTLLAETHCYPASLRWMNRIAAKAGRILRACVTRALASEWWRARVQLRGPYFLSNAAVLEKT